MDVEIALTFKSEFVHFELLLFDLSVNTEIQNEMISYCAFIPHSVGKWFQLPPQHRLLLLALSN